MLVFIVMLQAQTAVEGQADTRQLAADYRACMSETARDLEISGEPPAVILEAAQYLCASERDALQAAAYERGGDDMARRALTVLDEGVRGRITYEVVRRRADRRAERD